MNQPLILVTGATDGIGLETARELTRRGARVLVHGRDPERLQRAVAGLRALGGSPPEPVQADLSSLAAVRGLAAEIAARGHEPAVVIHNAGVFMKRRERSVDGLEVTLAVNHLAPFLLTHLLLESTPGDHLRRIVVVSSIAHNSGVLDLADVQGLARPFDGYDAYAASKLANVLFTVELARRLRPRRITVNALHPGVTSTKLLTEGFEMQGRDSLAQASANSVLLALDPALADITGAYYVQGRPAPTHQAARDPALCRRFYELSAELVGVAPLPA